MAEGEKGGEEETTDAIGGKEPKKKEGWEESYKIIKRKTTELDKLN